MARRSPPEGTKFMDADITDAMERIVAAHVRHYQSDYYDHDIRTIQNATRETSIKGRRFIWLPRTCGTWLFREYDVMTGIPQRKTFNYYYESYDGGALPFAIEIRCGNANPEHVRGDLFALDYGAEYEWLREHTFSADKAPELAAAVTEAAQWLSRHRMLRFPEGDLDGYIQGLAERRGAA